MKSWMQCNVKNEEMTIKTAVAWLRRNMKLNSVMLCLRKYSLLTFENLIESCLRIIENTMCMFWNCSQAAKHELHVFLN